MLLLEFAGLFQCARKRGVSLALPSEIYFESTMWRSKDRSITQHVMTLGFLATAPICRYDAQSSSTTEVIEQNKEQLTGVYERLAHIIAMESENGSSNPPGQT